MNAAGKMNILNRMIVASRIQLTLAAQRKRNAVGGMILIGEMIVLLKSNSMRPDGREGAEMNFPISFPGNFTVQFNPERVVQSLGSSGAKGEGQLQ
jgi:hypothetical protein